MQNTWCNPGASGSRGRVDRRPGTREPSGSVQEDFEIVLDETVPCYSTIEFQLAASSAEGGPWTFGFSKDVGQSAAPGGLPAAIPDGSGSLTNSFTVAQNDVISDLNVRVAISHTYVGDIKIQLRSPLGTLVTLLDRPGVPNSTYGCSNDNMNVTFDDASGFNLAAVTGIAPV